MTNQSYFIVFTDGGSRGNPGHAAVGIVIKNEKEETIKELSEYIGIATNNTAEYSAVIKALEHLSDLTKNETCEIKIHFFLDSELVVKQLNKEYKIKNTDIANFVKKIETLKNNFSEVKFSHVKREFNKTADKLVNMALDARLTSTK